jgi:hypothetical protein
MSEWASLREVAGTSVGGKIDVVTQSALRHWRRGLVP